MSHSGVLYVFESLRGPSNVAGHRVTYPLYLSFFSTGLNSACIYTLHAHNDITVFQVKTF